MTASKPTPGTPKKVTAITVQLPERTDYDQHYSYYGCTVIWTDRCGEPTPDGRKRGHTKVDKPFIAVGADGATIEWKPQNGTYTAGSLYAFAAILLAAGRQLMEQEQALDEAKAVIESATILPFIEPRRENPAA